MNTEQERIQVNTDLNQPYSILLEQARCGDAQAIEELYLSLLPIAQHNGRKYGANSFDAEDLASAAMLRVLEKGILGKAYNPTGSIDAWAHTVSSNIGKDHVKSPARKITPTPDAILEIKISEASDNPIETTIKRLLPAFIESMLEQASVTIASATALRLFYMEECSFQEIAEKLDLPSANAAKQAVQRAKIAIRKHFHIQPGKTRMDDVLEAIHL